MRVIDRGFAILPCMLLAACGSNSNAGVVGKNINDEVVRLDGAAPLPNGSAPAFSDRIDIKNGHGVYTSNRKGKLARIVFDVDLGRVDPARGHLFAPVGETEAGVVVIIDDYATSSRADASRCEDGMETFVRVFSLPSERELAAMPVGSCIDGIPRPRREAVWLPPDRFRVETNPARTFVIHDADTVSPVGAP